MKNIVAVLVLGLASLSASAERGDSLKDAVIDFNDAHIDQVDGTRVFTGKVVYTRGTLMVTADKAVVKETPDGYNYLVLTADPGKFVTFRQKTDAGPDQWFEGQAHRIEYDDRAELIKLFAKATVKQSEGKTVIRQMDDEYIAYDSRKEVLVGRNEADGSDKVGGGRGVITYAARRTVAAAAAPGAGNAR